MKKITFLTKSAGLLLLSNALFLFLAACSKEVDIAVEDNIEPPLVPDEWVLNQDKSDEFDEWNPAKWRTDLWFNISGAFAFKPENAFVREGNLVIKAQKESYAGKDYTAGVARSRFQVGAGSRVEVRAKLPDYRAHVTSALWMSVQPISANAPSLEIDLMEMYLFKNENHHSFTAGLHYWWSGGNIPDWVKDIQGTDQNLGWYIYSIDKPLSEDYHIWAIERTDNKLEYFFDGNLYWSHDITSETVNEGKRNPFIPEDYRKNFNEQPIDIIFNIEGHAGIPIEEHLPVELLVDYIRVYEKSGNNPIEPEPEPEADIIVVNSDKDGTEEQVKEMAQRDEITLRYATMYDQDHGVIHFDQSVADKTIKVIAPLIISRNVKIDGQTYHITIDGGNTTQIMQVNGGATSDESRALKDVSIFNLSFKTARNRDGGAILTREKLTIEDCIFEDNTSFTQGGAILVEKNRAIAELTIRRSYFRNNAVKTGDLNASGGAVAGKNGGEGQIRMYIENSIFVNNSAPTGGAVASWFNAQTTLYSNTFFSNTAANIGGAYYGNSTKTSIGGNIFLQNKDKAGYNDIYNARSWQHTFADIGYNVYQKEIVNDEQVSFQWGATSVKTADPTGILTLNDNQPKLPYILSSRGNTETRIIPQSIINGFKLNKDYTGHLRGNSDLHNAGAIEYR